MITMLSSMIMREIISKGVAKIIPRPGRAMAFVPFSHAARQRIFKIDERIAIDTNKLKMNFIALHHH